MTECKIDLKKCESFCNDKQVYPAMRYFVKEMNLTVNAAAKEVSNLTARLVTQARAREVWKTRTPKLHSLAGNSKAVIQWQKSNKNKVEAAKLARHNPHKVKILYECRCNTRKKLNHHFDYDRPYEVVRLCYECHGFEHRRLRKILEEAGMID